MDILHEAAKAWNELTKYTYHIRYGKHATAYEINLRFDKAEFYHLAGFQYLNDVVLPYRTSHPKIIDAVLTNKIAERHISKSKNFELVKDRLIAISKLEAMLDNQFNIYNFNPKVLPFYTKIPAKNLITAEVGDVIFLFTDDRENGEAYSKSIFLKRGELDYAKNQKALKILSVEKCLTEKETESMAL